MGQKAGGQINQGRFVIEIRRVKFIHRRGIIGVIFLQKARGLFSSRGSPIPRKGGRRGFSTDRFSFRRRRR
jgi:hypothetical protein